MTPVFSKLTGCILNIASVAILGTWDAGHLEEGARAWTADVRDVWVLAKNALAGTAADGITVIAATGAGASAFWIRQSEGDMYWSYQGTWSVDPAAGVDTNTGASPAQAIKTVAELSRRLVQVRQNTSFTVNLLGNIPVTDSFVDRRQIIGGAATKTLNGSTIFFTGQRTVTGTFSAAAGTHNTVPNVAVGNISTAQAEAIRAAGSWVAADVGKLIVDSSGNTAWILTEKDAAQTARVTDWLTSGGFWQATPDVEGTSSLCSVTTWRAPIITGSPAIGTSSGLGIAIYFQNVEFDDFNGSQAVGGVYNNGALLSLWVCKISDNNGAQSPTFFANGSFGLAIFQGVMVQHRDSANSYAFFYAGAAQSPGLHVQWLWGNGGRRVKVQLGTSPNQVQGLCIQAGWVECGNTKAEVPAMHNIGANQDGSWLGVYQDFGSLVVATLAAIQVNAGGRLRVDGSVYGTSAGGSAPGGVSGLASQNGGIMWLPRNMLAANAATPQLCFNLVPTGAGTEFYLDALASTTGSITAANGGAVLPISIVCTTFAQYIGAVPNGWARNMRNPANNGGFYQGL